MPSNIPETIRQAREAKGLTQRQLAVRLGIHPSAVYHWEAGNASPDIAHRIELSAVLSIRFTDLLPAGGEPVVLVTDPTVVKIVQIIEGAPLEQREALLRAIAVLLGLPEPLSAPAPALRRAKAR